MHVPDLVNRQDLLLNLSIFASEFLHQDPCGLCDWNLLVRRLVLIVCQYYWKKLQLTYIYTLNNMHYIRCARLPSLSENLLLGLCTVLPSLSIITKLSRLINSPIKAFIEIIDYFDYKLYKNLRWCMLDKYNKWCKSLKTLSVRFPLSFRGLAFLILIVCTHSPVVQLKTSTWVSLYTTMCPSR